MSLHLVEAAVQLSSRLMFACDFCMTCSCVYFCFLLLCRKDEVDSASTFYSLYPSRSVFLALFESAEAACCCVERKHVVFVSRDWVSGTMICTWGLKEDGRGWRGNETLRLKTL